MEERSLKNALYPAAAFYQIANLTFVIPTEEILGQRPTQGDENASVSNHSLWDAALSFVIPSEAEGSAVLRTLRGYVFRQSEAERRDLRFSQRLVRELCGFFPAGQKYGIVRHTNIAADR